MSLLEGIGLKLQARPLPQHGPQESLAKQEQRHNIQKSFPLLEGGPGLAGEHLICPVERAPTIPLPDTFFSRMQKKKSQVPPWNLSFFLSFLARAPLTRNTGRTLQAHTSGEPKEHTTLLDSENPAVKEPQEDAILESARVASKEWPLQQIPNFPPKPIRPPPTNK